MRELSRQASGHQQHAKTELGVRLRLPVIFGVLTCNTLEQAVARSGGDAATTGKDIRDSRIGNKGVDCAKAALEMIDLIAKLPERG